MDPLSIPHVGCVTLPPAVIFDEGFTVKLVLLVQPDDISVTVTLYVPGPTFNGFCPLIPPVHAYVAPVLGVTLMDPLSIPHVDCVTLPPAVIFDDGLTVKLVLFVQPKLCDKRIDEYNIGRKRNATYVRTNEWIYKRDPKHRSDVCMDRRFEWTKSIECRSRNIYGNGNGDGIWLYEQHKLYDKRLDEYNSRWKCNATDVRTNQWLHQRDTKHRSNLCMDRWIDWAKSIEHRPRHLYGNCYRDGIGLYEQHELYSEPFIKYHSRRKRHATDVLTNEWLHQRDTKHGSDVCMDRRLEWAKSIERGSR